MVPLSKLTEEVNRQHNKFHCAQIGLEIPVGHLREYMQKIITEDESSDERLGLERKNVGVLNYTYTISPRRLFNTPTIIM